MKSFFLFYTHLLLITTPLHRRFLLAILLIRQSLIKEKNQTLEYQKMDDAYIKKRQTKYKMLKNVLYKKVTFNTNKRITSFQVNCYPKIRYKIKEMKTQI